MTPVNIVKSIPLFSALDNVTIEQICSLSIIKTYAPHYTVINEGEESKQLFIILDGKVKVTSTSNRGREITLRILSGTDFLGEVFASEIINNNSTITTLSKTELLLIRKSDFQKYLLINPTLTIRFLQEVANRIRTAEFKIYLFSFSTAQYKIAAVIIQIAEKEGKIGKNVVMLEKFPRYSEIANMAGITRETVSRILHRFETEKLIELGKLKLVILDYEKFRKIYDLTKFKVDMNDDLISSRRSVSHLPRKGRFQIFSGPDLNKIWLKYY